jgi:hypothetical protein
MTQYIPSENLGVLGANAIFITLIIMTSTTSMSEPVPFRVHHKLFCKVSEGKNIPIPKGRKFHTEVCDHDHIDRFF